MSVGYTREIESITYLYIKEGIGSYNYTVLEVPRSAFGQLEEQMVSFQSVS